MHPSQKSNLPALIVICISILWWTYLGSLSQMIIVHDAIGYQSFGEMIDHKGFLEYLKTGPNREPFYAILVSISFRFADLFHVSYSTIQICLQVGLLLISQLLLWRILRALNLKTTIECIILLYFGLSPAINNAAFSLFSEIGAFIFVLAIILICRHSILFLHQPTTWSILFKNASFLGLTIFLAAMVKGVFEIIFFFFVFYFAYLAFTHWLSKDFVKLKKVIFFIFIFLITFECPLLGYKYLNQKYNGHFVLTDRGSWALYGQTARRLKPLNSQQLAAALSYTTGEPNCQKLFNDQQCQEWSFIPSDQLGQAKYGELVQKLPVQKIDQTLIKLSFSKMIENPGQYLLLWSVECLKIFFWETTHIGFVIYPDWLTKLYNNDAFDQLIKFTLAFLSLASLFYSIFILKSKLPATTSSILIPSLILVVGFTTMHAFFLILPRYGLPIASIHLILIGFTFNQLMNQFKKS